MAFPQKHTVTVNTQVRGGVNRIAALQAAADYCEPRIHGRDEVLEVADEFLAWLKRVSEPETEGE